MKYSTGTRFNFSVAAGLAEVMRLEVGKAGSLDGLSVSGAVFRFAYEVEGVVHNVPVEHGEVAGALVLRVPALEAGVYRYALEFADDVGDIGVLLHGDVTAISQSMADELVAGAEEAKQRVLCVEAGSLHSGPLELRWQASSVAGVYAAQAKQATLALEDVREAVAEFRVFVAGWKDDLPSVLVMNPVTGTIWVGGMDTGEPYRGQDGKAPRVNAEGFWEVFRDGAWVTLPYSAVGKDGLDGTAVRFVLVDSFEDIPQSGETCNGGFRYLVKHEGWAVIGDVAAAQNGEWEAWEMPAHVLPSEFTQLRVPGALNANSTAVYLLVRTAEGEVLGVSQNAVTWAVGDVVTWEFAEPVRVPNGATVQMFLRKTNEAVTGAVPNEGVLLKSLLGNDGVCRVRYHAVWYGGRTPYLLAFGAGASEFYDEYAWVEQAGSAGWVRLPRVGELATAQVYGAMLYGTDMTVTGGAPVGRDAAGRAHVPLASSTVPGVAMPSSPEVSDDGGGIHVSLTGTLLTDLATPTRLGSVKLGTSSVIASGALVGVNASGQLMVPLATTSSNGVFRLGTNYPTDPGDGYRVGVGAYNGQLCIAFVPRGALRHWRPKTWAVSGMAWVSGVDWPSEDSYYSCLLTSEQFTQTEADGLVLRAASTSLRAGVRIASSMEDEDEDQVLNVQLAKEFFALKSDAVTREEAVLKTDPYIRGMVLTEEDYNALGTKVDPELTYVLI